MKAGLIGLILIVAAIAIFLVGLGVGHVAAKASRSLTDLNQLRKKVGLSNEMIRIYRDGIQLLNKLVAFDEIRDLTAPVEHQVILPGEVRAEIKDLLNDYRKEYNSK